jgi:hypothetical protein
MSRFDFPDDPHQQSQYVQVDPNQPGTYVINVGRQRQRARLPGCMIALLVLLIAIPSCLGIAVGGLALAGVAGLGNIIPGVTDLFNQLGGSLVGVSSRSVANPTAYNPIAQFDEARAFAGPEAQLVDFHANGVRSDGTVDLTVTSFNAFVTYEFVNRVPPPENAPPVGAGGAADGVYYEPVRIEAFRPGTMRTISQTGGGMSVRSQVINQGLMRTAGDVTANIAGEVIPPPACSFAALWQIAIEREDAPANAVASIRYDEDGYDFNIQGVASLDFDTNCRLER